MVPNGKRWSMLSIAIGCYVSSITRQDSVWDGDAVIPRRLQLYDRCLYEWFGNSLNLFLRTRRAVLSSSRLWRSASAFCCSGPIRIAGRAKDPHSTRGAPGRSLRLESDL